MKMQNPFKLLNKFEMSLWLTSVAVVLLSYVLSGFEGLSNTICSLNTYSLFYNITIEQLFNRLFRYMLHFTICQEENKKKLEFFNPL